MRALNIALITTIDPAEARRMFWDPILRAWPDDSGGLGAVVEPRLHVVSLDALIEQRDARKAVQGWDAAIIAPLAPPIDSHTYRLFDFLQQALLPAVAMVTRPDARLAALSPGTLFVHTVDDDPQRVAGILATLAERQEAVRGLDQNLRLSQSFQGEAAAEIDRLHQELLLAAKVQRDFLPKEMPRVPGLECSVLFRPAGFVSGDTYDVSRLDDDHVSFFLADAMGHGVPAALMTLYIDGSLPRKEITPEGYRLVPPAEAITRLNEELCESSAGPTRFVTAVCGLIDLRSGLITLACAGHPPPLRVGPSGVRPVEVSGMLLGVVPDYRFEQVQIRLEENEILLIHSDGVEGAFLGCSGKAPGTHADGGRVRPPPRAFYEHLDALRKGRLGGIEDVTSAMELLATDLDRQMGSFHQDDDVTVLAFQTAPIAAERSIPAPAAAGHAC